MKHLTKKVKWTKVLMLLLIVIAMALLLQIKTTEDNGIIENNDNIPLSQK